MLPRKAEKLKPIRASPNLTLKPKPQPQNPKPKALDSPDCAMAVMEREVLVEALREALLGALRASSVLVFEALVSWVPRSGSFD